jgi:indolepyruvate ferredoxin oxidoreductase beta subunit
MTKLEKPYQISIAGVGGTGVLTAAGLIANTALIKDINVTQSEIHGMAQRGGVVNTEIRIGPVSGPLIPEGGADVLLSFEAAETARAIRRIKPQNGKVIMNSHKVVPPSLSAKRGGKYPDLGSITDIIKKFTQNVYVIDAYKLAEKAGDLRTQNVVLIGALFALPDFPLKQETFEESLKIRFKGKEKVIESNMKAFNLGKKKMEEFLG